MAGATSAERFDAQYPEELGERLAWLERRLGVSRARILRLIGLPAAEAASEGRSWEEIAHAHEAQAERAEHLLTHYLSYFDYDPEKAGDFVRDFGQKVERGAIRLADHVPRLTAATTPEEEDEALLCSLRDEGPTLLPAIARFLANRPLWLTTARLVRAPESPDQERSISGFPAPTPSRPSRAPVAE